MPPTASQLASRPAVRWLLIASALAAGAALATVMVLDDGIEYRTCEEKLEIMEDLEAGRSFTAVLADRVIRWFEDHPNACPRSEDIASFRELADHNVRLVEFVCHDNHLLAMTMYPLVHFYPRTLAGLD